MPVNNENFLATKPSGGSPLKPIPHCWIDLGGGDINPNRVGPDLNDRIELFALPEIQDSKSVNYSDQIIQGRAAPVKTYANSSNRTINLVLHLYVTTLEDIENNLNTIRKIAALTHPEYDGTYLPPRIARIKCGKLLSESPSGVPVVLKQYDVNYETDVQWFYHEVLQTYMPLHVSIQTSWDVVYSWTNLPGYSDVIKGAY